MDVGVPAQQEEAGPQTVLCGQGVSGPQILGGKEPARGGKWSKWRKARSSPGEHGDAVNCGAREPSNGHRREGPRGGRRARTPSIPGAKGGRSRVQMAGPVPRVRGPCGPEEERKDLILFDKQEVGQGRAQGSTQWAHVSCRWSQGPGRGRGGEAQSPGRSPSLFRGLKERADGRGWQRKVDGGRRTYLSLKLPGEGHVALSRRPH